MKKLFSEIRVLFTLVVVLSCGSDVKKYEDYNEDEFYEAQGIVTKVTRSPGLFDSPRSRTVYYDYYLDLERLKKGDSLSGFEENIDLVINPGDPIVVLVHKKDSLITFFGRYGLTNDSF